MKYVWDDLQSSTKCCGVDSYKDWANITGSCLEKGAVPKFCCIDQYMLEHGKCNGSNMAIANETYAAKYIYTNGCKEHIVAYWKPFIVAFLLNFFICIMLVILERKTLKRFGFWLLSICCGRCHFCSNVSEEEITDDISA